MGQSSDFIMSEGSDAMGTRGLGELVGFAGVLKGLTGVLISSQVFLFPVLFASAVSVRGAVV